ncbi:MAG: ORC1-type DNA replication protein [Candidatus Aenigmarchaeota archaeon]|nr:ORC1-type DNA replication protein [Candidatus Aenigmarchaeota archaeon]
MPMADIQNIFNKFLENKPIFANRQVLTISFTPREIPHRDEQTNELGRILAPALKGGRPSNIFIYGRTGTGKTCLAKMVTSELEKAAHINGFNVKTLYINCKMKKSADTEYRLLAGLSREFGYDVPFTGLPTDQIYNIFFKALDSESQTVILIIDEIDTLVQKTGDEILYNLTRINEDLKNSRLTIIGITNNLDFIEKLDPRVRSSLSEEEIVFPPYNAIQLQDILRQRAEIAFMPNVLEDGVIEKCAALAAQEHGDARRALDLLRVAGEIAERKLKSKVSIEDIDAAEDKIDVDRIIEVVKSQPKQSQAVLWSILNLEKRYIETSDILDKYKEICVKNGLKQLTSRRISDLINELVLFGILNSKVVSRGRYGRTKLISLNINNETEEKLKKMLGQIFLC